MTAQIDADEIKMILLSPEQVARRLQVPLRTLYAWRHAGRGPTAYRVGRHLRYREQDLQVWLETQRDVG